MLSPIRRAQRLIDDALVDPRRMTSEWIAAEMRLHVEIDTSSRTVFWRLSDLLTGQHLEEGRAEGVGRATEGLADVYARRAMEVR